MSKKNLERIELLLVIGLALFIMFMVFLFIRTFQLKEEAALLGCLVIGYMVGELLGDKR